MRSSAPCSPRCSPPAASHPRSRTQVHVIPEFSFENGQRLRDMKVGYVTRGQLNAARSNAVLVTHATNGLRNSFNVFIGPGKALDTDRYFVVTVDGIGGGLSSSPKDGLGTSFPRYTIRDMVRAQHDLIARGLGLPGLLAVGGPSMGSFQALEWGIHYPDFVRGLILIVPAAKSDAQFQMLADTMIATVQLDPAWQGGEWTDQPERRPRARGDDLHAVALQPGAHQHQRAQRGGVSEDADGLRPGLHKLGRDELDVALLRRDRKTTTCRSRSMAMSPRPLAGSRRARSCCRA